MQYNDSQTAVNNVKFKSVLQQIVGWGLSVFFGLGFIGGIGASKEDPSTVGIILFCLILTVLGIWMIVLGVRNRKLVRAFLKYSAYLAGDSSKSIDHLAASIGKNRETVKKNIDKMISRGFFPNAYIDIGRNCLVISSTDTATTNLADNAFVTMQCSGCGATNKILQGNVGECEYCGSPLSDKK